MVLIGYPDVSFLVNDGVTKNAQLGVVVDDFVVGERLPFAGLRVQSEDGIGTQPAAVRHPQAAVVVEGEAVHANVVDGVRIGGIDGGNQWTVVHRVVVHLFVVAEFIDSRSTGTEEEML